MRNIVKKSLFFLLSLGFLAACDIRADLIEIQNDIDSLRLQMEQMDGSIVSLRALLEEVKAGGIISSLSFLTDGQDTTGYVLAFQDGRTITIHEGRDGYSPELGVRADEDGVWCWTLDGEWLKDGEGNRIPAAARNGVDGVDGVTPRFKIIDDYWYLSMDGGENWTRLDKAKGEDAPSVFKEVDTRFDDHVVFVLMDGSTIEIPLYQPVALTLGLPEEGNGLGPGETLAIPYEISGSITDRTVVTAGTDGHYTLTMERRDATSGTIYVTCPAEYGDGFVYVLVNDGEGHSAVRVVNFYERRIEIADGWSFRVDCRGETLTLPLQYNFDYELVVEDAASEWIHVEQTRAGMQDGAVVFLVDPNPADAPREGRVLLRPVDNPAYVYASFVIKQASAIFTIDRTSFTVESAGNEYDVTIRSSRGVSLKLPEGIDWLSAGLQEQQDTSWVLHLAVGKNEGDAVRKAEIQLWSGDGSALLGTVSMTQLSSAVDHEKDLVLEVRASEILDFKVSLPLSGEVDCVIDWGDGTVEAIQDHLGTGVYPSHSYDIAAPATYTISVSGTVAQLNAENMPDREAIRAVVQWGDLGLRSMEGAFANCTQLSSVPEDPLEAFSDVVLFNRAFYRCLSLKQVPEKLFAHCTAARAFSSLFAEGGLEEIPEGLFAGCPSAVLFDNAFRGCKNLLRVPEALFAACTKAEDFSGVFRDTRFPEIPGGIFRNCPAVTSFEEAFRGAKITAIPEALFAGNPEVLSFQKTFRECLQVVDIPAGIFDRNRKVTNFEGVFFKGNAATAGKESPFTLIDGVKVHLYERAEYPDSFVTPLEHEDALEAFFDGNDPEGEPIPDDWR